MDEELIRNNEMIAAYLDGVVREGWRVQDNAQMVWEGNVAAIYREAFMKLPIGRVIITDQLKFHESWDWLMPVVEKIKKDNWVKIELQEDYTFCLISSPQLGADPVTLEERVEDMSPISVVYDAVITYIKWYNEKHDRRAEGRADTTANPH